MKIIVNMIENYKRSKALKNIKNELENHFYKEIYQKVDKLHYDNKVTFEFQIEYWKSENIYNVVLVSRTYEGYGIDDVTSFGHFNTSQEAFDVIDILDEHLYRVSVKYKMADLCSFCNTELIEVMPC